MALMSRELCDEFCRQHQKWHILRRRVILSICAGGSTLSEEWQVVHDRGNARCGNTQERNGNCRMAAIHRVTNLRRGLLCRGAAAFFAVVVATALLPLPAAGEPLKAKFNRVVNVGDMAPAWSGLAGVDDKAHSLVDYRDAKVLVVVFTCNHCPVAQAYESRLLDLARKYREKAVQVVAINVSLNQADSLDTMKERSRQREYPFPYLFDGSQASGRAYGATVTPHVFVLDGQRRIAYMGAFDDNMDAAEVKKNYVVDAVDALLVGKSPPVRESLQRGCGIRYKDK